jgi:hypothetical protein
LGPVVIVRSHFASQKTSRLISNYAMISVRPSEVCF